MASKTEDAYPSLETPSLFRRKKEEVITADESLEEEPTEDLDFTQEELQSAWIEFRDLRKKGGAGDMEMMVLNRAIEKREPHYGLIRLGSALETSILDRFEDDAVQFLRKKLNHSLIRLQHEVQETETSKKLYTSKDKYEYMISQNPALKELKERLGLDFDY